MKNMSKEEEEAKEKPEEKEGKDEKETKTRNGAGKDEKDDKNEDHNLQEPKPEKYNKKVVVCQGHAYNVYDFYDIQKIVGAGAFGIVCSALNKKDNTMVAIKKIKDAFSDLLDTKRILREIKLLKFFKHKNIIKLIDVIKPDSPTNYTDILLVFEYMQIDLEQLIKSKQVLTDDHIKLFLYQILCGIYHMHSAEVIHRDLKPNNLFVNKNCELKIGDLGLARKVVETLQTDYVVTRWYRAPEIMLSSSEHYRYTKAIDIWSVGCIFAELLGRTPIFPGKHYLDQLQRVIAVLGTPEADSIPYKIEENTLKFIKSLPVRVRTKWELLFPKANPLGLDLLEKMLCYNPNKRFTVEQCLLHPYLESMNKENSLLKCNDAFDWSFDKQIELKTSELQKAIYNEASDFQY